MVTALLYLVVAAVVGGVFFLLASLVFGRGEELAPLDPGTTLTTLPASDVAGDDVRALRFAQVVRGYRASEVDWALERLAAELDALRAELAGRTVVTAAPARPGDAVGSPRHAEPDQEAEPAHPTTQEDHP